MTGKIYLIWRNLEPNKKRISGWEFHEVSSTHFKSELKKGSPLNEGFLVEKADRKYELFHFMKGETNSSIGSLITEMIFSFNLLVETQTGDQAQHKYTAPLLVSASTKFYDTWI